MGASIARHPIARVVTIAAAAAVLLSACASPSNQSQTPTNGGTFTWGLDADAQTLNPFVAGDLPSSRALAFMFPNLYSADKNLNVVPDLADGMPQVSSDGTVWTVKLKSGAKWSDGSPITSNDVVTTVKIQADPNLDTDGGFDWSSLDKVESVDTLTVKFTLKKPFAPFLANSLVGWIAPAAVYGKIDPAKQRTDPVSQKPTVTGGPYKFDRWVPGQEIDYVANDTYFAGRPHFDKVVARVITDATASTSAIINGDIQWTPTVAEAGAGAVQRVQAAGNLTYHSFADLQYIDIRMNERAGHPFSDVLVRRAFAYALDKDSIVQAAKGVTGVPLWGDITPASWAYDANAQVKYKQDITKAKALMQQAGWAIGSDGIATKNGKRFSYKLRVRAGKPDRLKAVQIISDQVKAIGMDLQPDQVDFKVFYKPLFDGTYDVAIAGFSLTLDPDEYTVLHSSQLQPEHKQGQNWTGYSSPQLDALIDQERSTVKTTLAATQAARKPIFNQIQQILGNDVVTYYLWADRTTMAWSGNIANVVAGNGDNTIYVDQGRDTRVFSEWWIKSAK
jgi:peptide/nickel transport system substrate-binding protein